MKDKGREDLNFNWTDAELAVISAAMEGPGEVYDVSSRVKEAISRFDPLTDKIKALVRALDYMDVYSRRAPGDDLYAPMMTTEDFAYPEPLSTLTEETIASWLDASFLFTKNDVVVARVNDLLWVVKAQPAPHLRARAAHEALRRLWDREDLNLLTRSDSLIRATQIAVELRDQELFDQMIPLLVASSGIIMDGDEWAPGAALPLLEVLVGSPHSSRPDNLSELIEHAKERYASDPFIVESILLLEMQLAGGDIEHRKRLASGVVAMWERVAEASGGLLRVSHLERALSLALNEGLSVDVARVRVALQRPQSTVDLGMQTISSEVSIPSADIENFISTFLSRDSGHEALLALASYWPIHDIDSDKSHVLKQMREHPIQHLFATVVTNSDGLPLAHVTTDSQKFEHALMRQHALAVTFWGTICREVLDRLTALGRLVDDEVGAFANGNLFGAPFIQHLKVLFTHYQVGGYAEVVSLGSPQIERSIRTVARDLGLSVYREPSLDGATMGAYRGLHDLLRALDGRLHDSLLRYLKVLLVERTGLNLRNRVCHGLSESYSAEEAALIIHATVIVATWRLTEIESGED